MNGIIFSILTYILTANAILTTPGFLLSTTLIPGLKVSLVHSEQLPFSQSEANILFSRGLESCTNDNYVFIKIPGLRVADFQNFQNWINLRKHFTRASTILTMPNIVAKNGNDDNDNDNKDLINWDNLESILKIDCGVEAHYIEGMDLDHIPRFRNAHKRLVSIKLSDELTFLEDNENIEDEGSDQRTDFLKQIDEFILGVSRKFPSHKLGIIIVGEPPYNNIDEDEISNVDEIVEFKDIPDDPKVLSVSLRDKVRRSKRFIFPDITVFDKSRYFEFERNDIGERHLLRDLKDNEWAKDAGKKPGDEFVDDTWLPKKEPHVHKEENSCRFGEDEKVFKSVFENRQFILDNALWIVCSVLFFVVYVFFDIVKTVYLSVHSYISKRSAANVKRSTNPKKD